jgi:DNA-binding transcriptional LysR family regulator
VNPTVDVRLEDLTAFLAVARSHSMSAAARELRVTTSKLSKVVTRLERQFGRPLFARTAQGVRLTEEGQVFAGEVHSIVSRVTALKRARPADLPLLGVGAPSYLLSTALPAIASLGGAVRFRGVELPPSLIRSAFGERFFDLALLPGECPRLPPTWEAVAVGSLKKRLYARPDVVASLGPPPVSPEELLGQRFVLPSYWVNGGFVAVDDDCPLPLERRRPGQEVATFRLALDVAATTGELAFGPELAARHHVRSGHLAEVVVEGWDVQESLYLCVETGRVSRRLRDGLVEALARLVA